MLSILTDKGYFPLDNRQNFNIVYDYEGEQTLSFDISPNDPYYSYVIEKAKLKYGDNRYNIRKINKRKTMSTITAELDLNEWKTRMHLNFHSEYDLFTDVIALITPEGWIFDDVGAAKGRRAITLEGVTDYDILMVCKKTYGIAFEYHILDRRIKVIDPLVIQECGLYLTDELNLDSVEYKGDYTQQANRLYAFGKKEEIENEDGAKTTTYVNFADINQGRTYVECTEYVSDEIVCAYWQDDRYTIPENLLTDAIEKVRALAYPIQAWNCNIHDLSRTNDMYKMLDFKLYDKPTLLTDGQSIVHQIVRYTDYPDNQNLNKVVLSTAFKKIQGEITEIKTNINDLDLDLKVKEYLINEIRRDVNSNTLLIQDTYRKGDIDTRLTSIIQQTENDINLAVGSVERTFYMQNAGYGSIYDDCAVSISKDNNIETEVSLSDMTLNIKPQLLRGNSVLISVDIYARNAIPKTLSGYMGAYFTVTYTDNTIKKYMCAYYPGVRYLQQQLSQGSTSMYQRIYTTCTINDKSIKSVSNLTITIACNGESLKVSNPKVEIGTEPINGELGIRERVRKAEIQLTPDAITQKVGEKLNGDGELKTVKFVLDKNGGHFSGGGIDISNNAGEKVLFADTNGNLTARNLTLTEGNISGSSTINISNDLKVGRNIVLDGARDGLLYRSIKMGASSITSDFNADTPGTTVRCERGNGESYLNLSADENYPSLTMKSQRGGAHAYMSLSGNKDAPSFAITTSSGAHLSSASDIILMYNDVNIGRNLLVFGKLSAEALYVNGQKYRVVKDSIEGKVLMNAVESTYAVFEDYGTNTLNENGRCVIRLDKRFLATVNASEPYFTFLTPLGEGTLYTKSKYNFAFVVAGTPNLSFDWRVTIKQRGYENDRMEEYNKEVR